MNEEVCARFRAVAAARVAEVFPGGLVIDGVAYEGALKFGTVEAEGRQGERVQMRSMTFSVEKGKMAARPEVGKKVTREGVPWKLVAVDGEGAVEVEPCWVLRWVQVGG
jgi:hypothetical protein